jgi:CIC family chloride channel protein
VEPDFTVPSQPFPGFATVPVNIVLGIVAGLVGAAYTHAVLGSLTVADLASWIPAEVRAALIGGLVGLLAWLFAPQLVGGGDAITQQTLLNHGALSAIVLIFAVRFALGPLSYAAGTPGGLFAPMLVLGAQIGVVFGRLCVQWFPDAAASPTAYAVVGMTAFFTSVVRAPLTGIALATEMTGNVNLLLPMLAACFGAMVVTNLLGIPPIYDLLHERVERRTR